MREENNGNMLYAPDYRNMSAKDAVRLAYDVSGKTYEEIARASGLSKSAIKNFLLKEDGYLPNLDRIEPLCKGLGNIIPFQWLEAQFKWERQEIAPAKSRAEVLTALAMAQASLGDAQRALADCEERGIDPPCARVTRSMLLETIAQCKRAYGMLEELASHRDWTEVEPLASLGREKKSWWRLWG